jgi:hypothetical protein
MAFSKTRRSRNTGSNPGLTPIDDIHDSNTNTGMDPDSTTGRLPAQDETSESGGKRRRSPKKGTRKSS